MLSPIAVLLRLMDGEMPVMGKIYDRMCIIGQKIDARDFSWKEDAKNIHEDRWEYLHSKMHAAGYALDPEFQTFSDDFDAATQNGLLEIIGKVCLRDQMAESKDMTLTLKSQSVLDRIAKTEVELATYQAREGIFTMANVIANAKTLPPHRWWRNYCKHLPLLSSVARRVLAQPVCASAAERNWSVYGQIKTTARARMGHAVGDKLVFCHESLHLVKNKLQKANYKL